MIFGRPFCFRTLSGKKIWMDSAGFIIRQPPFFVGHYLAHARGAVGPDIDHQPLGRHGDPRISNCTQISAQPHDKGPARIVTCERLKGTR